MPNAKEANVPPGKSILILGDTGGGKTTQFLTLPGPKFAYLFDPNALSSIQGQDVEYQEFLPDNLSLSLTSLKKDVAERALTHAQKMRGAEVYRAWEEDFEKKLESGYFEQYENISLDSATTLLDMIMDGILAINGRGGQWPQQDDYAPQMLTFSNIMRTLTSMGKRVYVTGHMETKQDETTSRLMNVPMFTGRLRKKTPILFSEVLVADAQTDNRGHTTYRIQTKPDRYNPTIRCSIKGLQAFEDVSLDDNKPLEGQGLGGLIQRALRGRPNPQAVGQR